MSEDHTSFKVIPTSYDADSPRGHHGERCFLPIHVCDTATGRPVAMLLRTGETPSGAEVGAWH